MTSNLVSLARNLQQRKGRRRRALTLVEGIRLVEEAVAAGLPFEGAMVSPRLGETPRGVALLESLAAHAVRTVDVPERELARLAATVTPQGIVAIVGLRRWTLGDIRPVPGAPVMVLDAVQDPGNVGTLLRTGYALGAAGAILLEGSADLTNPKVIRSAMGASFSFPTVRATDGELRAWVKEGGIAVWAAATAGTSVERVPRPERLAIILGNEGAGVREGLRELAQTQVSIPLARGAESLNVAVAAGILLREATRHV